MQKIFLLRDFNGEPFGSELRVELLNRTTVPLHEEGINVNY